MSDLNNSEFFAMYEFPWQCSSFDDDDDDFGFEEGHAELASELREYADDDDDEFDEDDRVTPLIVKAPVMKAPAAKVAVKRAARKAPAKKAVARKASGKKK